MREGERAAMGGGGSAAARTSSDESSSSSCSLAATALPGVGSSLVAVLMLAL
jgi:hypothetical protein